jgi:predicted PurR-regulated permease PerM
MLGLPPETVYHQVREGVITVAGLGLVLVVAVAWRMGQLATLAPMLFSGALLAMLTPTVLVVRRRYRHVLAAMLVLAVLLGLLVAAVHRYGYPSTLAFVVGPTPSAIADAVSPR